uniref:Plant disease resistance WDH domain-containing protein n=1 Tax=Arundo donax TaxID=35708 RepID=A0A0A9CL29_ARUDO
MHSRSSRKSLEDTLGLNIVGSILSELPITLTRLLDTLNRTLPIRDFSWNEREVLSLKNHEILVRLLDVCLSIFDHANGPRSLATRMVQVCGWFAPSAVPIHMLGLAAHKVPKKHRRGPRWRKWWRGLTCGLVTFRLCYTDICVQNFLPSQTPMSDSDTRVRFRVLSAVSQKFLPNRTPAPESDTDICTRVHVTQLLG